MKQIKPNIPLLFGRQGFTLIELLLGIVIFSFIILSVYSIFWSGIRLSQHSEKGSNVDREARWVFMIISQDLENMVPYNFAGSYPEQVACQGAKDRLTFLIPSEDGLKVVSYYLLSPDWGRRHVTQLGKTSTKNIAVILTEERSRRVNYLMRKERTLAEFLNGDSDEASMIEILATHVIEGGLKFSYGYLENEESNVSIWKDEWKENYIPSNVKIEIDFLPAEDSSEVWTLHRDVLIPTGFWGSQESS